MRRSTSLRGPALAVGLILALLAAGTASAAEPAGHEYWLGLMCRPLPEPLRAQLKVSGDEGLLVEQVVPDSPAAAAKIERFDVVVKAGGKVLKTPAELVEAVKASDGKKISLEVVRGGKPLSIEVSPGKRPATLQIEGASVPNAFGDENQMKSWLERLPGLSAPGQPLRFRLIHPGAVLPPGAAVPLPSPLPANMTVTITKTGDKPAKISVSRDDQKWETTEDHLEKLPADVRSSVEGMLAGHGFNVLFGSGPNEMNFVPEPGSIQPAVPPPPGGSHLDQRLDEMSRQINDLRKAIERLDAGQKR